MTPDDDRFAQAAEAEIRRAIDERVRAVRHQDVDALMAGYAPGVVTFDIIAPLANAGAGAVRERVATWFASFTTPIEYELRDVRVTAAGDVAFDHHVTHVRGTNQGGETVDMWFRETVGYRKVDGRWLVTHQHSSVPFDMKDGKALLGLQP